MSAHKTLNRQVTGDYGPSPDLWKGFPYLDVLHDPEVGWVDEDIGYKTFGGHGDSSGAAVSGPLTGGYLGYIYQGGAIAPASRQGGGLVFSSDGDNEGAAIQRNVAQFILSPSYGDVFFEVALLTSTITDTKHGFFAGLIQAASVAAAVPLTTAGALADKNLIGFHRLEGDGDKLDFVYKADGQTAQTHAADAVTLVADTFTRVGFRFRRSNESTSRIEGWVDGVQISEISVTKAQMAAATFPNDTYLGFCFGVMNATATTPGNSTLCWHRVGQLAA